MNRIRRPLFFLFFINPSSLSHSILFEQFGVLGDALLQHCHDCLDSDDDAPFQNYRRGAWRSPRLQGGHHHPVRLPLALLRPDVFAGSLRLYPRYCIISLSLFLCRRRLPRDAPPQRQWSIIAHIYSPISVYWSSLTYISRLNANLFDSLSEYFSLFFVISSSQVSKAAPKQDATKRRHVRHIFEEKKNTYTSWISSPFAILHRPVSWPTQRIWFFSRRPPFCLWIYFE